MSRKAAIVGLGPTPMSLRPGPEAAQLASDAITRALTDAGMTRGDVDGLLVNSSQGIRPDRVGVALARHDGFGDLALLEHIEIKGATAAAMIQRAVLAIEAGLASTVVCVFADAPIQGGGASGSTFAQSGGNAGVRSLERASGQLGSVPTYTLLAARYLHREWAALELEQTTCDSCGAQEVQWRVIEPRGIVHSATTVHRLEPGLVLTTEPYQIVDVEFASTHRLLMTTTEPTDDPLLIDTPVLVGFRTIGGVAVPAVSGLDTSVSDPLDDGFVALGSSAGLSVGSSVGTVQLLENDQPLSQTVGAGVSSSNPCSRSGARLGLHLAGGVRRRDGRDLWARMGLRGP